MPKVSISFFPRPGLLLLSALLWSACVMAFWYLIDAVMTLIAFLPVLLRLSVNVTELPLIGHIPYALVVVAIVWSLFGTLFLALVGIMLPGLEFRNQRVEAAYRKELVYGEDRADRAQPPTVWELFANVRRNYFRLY